MTDTPQPGDRVLTVRAPWPTAIFELGKTVENRSWPIRKANYGRLWIHVANKAATSTDIGDLAYVLGEDDEILDTLNFNEYLGCIIGSVEVTDCVPAKLVHSLYSLKKHRKWAGTKWCWILDNPQLLDKPIKASGALGLWKYKG